MSKHSFTTNFFAQDSDSSKNAQLLNENELTKLTKLIRIQLSQQKLSEYTKECNMILCWMQQLSKVNTKSNMLRNKSLRMREDNIQYLQSKREDVLCNTQTKHNCFIVPKVINEE